MTTFIIPLISALPIMGIAFLWNNYVFPPLSDAISVLPAAALTIAVGFIILPLGIFLPLTGLLGGWDDFQLKTFKKAVELSGPSKFITVPFYKAVELGVRLNPKLHNRFKIPWERAERQIKELQIMKIKHTFVSAGVSDPREFFLQKALEKKQKRLKKKQQGG